MERHNERAAEFVLSTGADVPSRIPLKPKLGRCAYKETKLHKPLGERISRKSGNYISDKVCIAWRFTEYSCVRQAPKSNNYGRIIRYEKLNRTIICKP